MQTSDAPATITEASERALGKLEGDLMGDLMGNVRHNLPVCRGLPIGLAAARCL